MKTDRETFDKIMNDIESLTLDGQKYKTNEYHINSLIETLQELFGYPYRCASCGEFGTDEDFMNDMCKFCGESAK